MPSRVLIVDDHAPYRAIARQLLVADGFTVVGEAGDAAGAISAARELRPDVVLLDVQLPDLDGFSVADVLATHPGPPVVVLVSSRAGSDYGSRIGRSCALGFIAKSDLSGDALRRLLRQPGEQPCV